MCSGVWDGTRAREALPCSFQGGKNKEPTAGEPFRAVHPENWWEPLSCCVPQVCPKFRIKQGFAASPVPGTCWRQDGIWGKGMIMSGLSLIQPLSRSAFGAHNNDFRLLKPSKANKLCTCLHQRHKTSVIKTTH